MNMVNKYHLLLIDVSRAAQRGTCGVRDMHIKAVAFADERCVLCGAYMWLRCCLRPSQSFLYGGTDDIRASPAWRAFLHHHAARVNYLAAGAAQI